MLFQNADQNGSRQPEARVARQRSSSDVYDLSLQAEWWLMSHYCAADFGHRFAWPEMRLETGRHFLREAPAANL